MWRPAKLIIAPGQEGLCHVSHARVWQLFWKIISILMSRLYLRGEIQQHVVVRILRDVGNGVTFILV